MNSPFPMVIIRENGEIIWYNNNFGELVSEESFITPYIQDMFTGFVISKNELTKCEVKIENRYFEAYGIYTKSPIKEKKPTD